MQSLQAAQHAPVDATQHRPQQAIGRGVQRAEVPLDVEHLFGDFMRLLACRGGIWSGRVVQIVEPGGA